METMLVSNKSFTAPSVNGFCEYLLVARTDTTVNAFGLTPSSGPFLLAGRG